MSNIKSAGGLDTEIVQREDTSDRGSQPDSLAVPLRGPEDPPRCPEAQAKATVLTMVDMDSGYVGVLMVSGKSTDIFTVRSSSSFVDKLRAEKTRLRYDNEPAMRLLAEKIAAFRHPRTTILEPVNRAEHQSVG